MFLLHLYFGLSETSFTDSRLFKLKLMLCFDQSFASISQFFIESTTE